MLIRIVAFLLETLFFVLIAACLLRAWMNWTRTNMRAQPGIFVMAVSDWIVKPIRRLMPARLGKAKVDWASVLAGLVFALVYGLLWAVLFGALSGAGELTAFGPATLLAMLVFAVKMLLRVALQAMMIMLFAFVILSWVQPGSPIYSLLGRLTEPLLGPLRRVVPTVGGIDLSALALIILLQIGLILLA
jgi:YggT family protein